MGYVDRVAVKVWPDTRSFDREMRRTTEKRRETIVQAILDSKQAKAELKKLENSRSVMDLDLRTAAAKAKLTELNREMGRDGEKSVKINADIRQARLRIAELRADMARTSDKSAKLAIRADIREARARIAELSADLARVREHKVKVNLEATKARRELRKLEEDRKIILQAKAETLNARRELMMVARRRIAAIWVRVNSTKAMADIKKIMAGLTGLNLLRSWKDSLIGLFENLPQTILRVTSLAAALSLLVLPLMGVMSAMAPLGRSLRAIGPAILGVIPIFAGLVAMTSVLVFAFKDLRKTSSVEAKRFLRVWDGVKAKLAGVKKAVQDAFFSSKFTAGFKHLTDKLLPDLRKGLAVVATGVGDVGSAMMRAFTKALDDGKLAKFFANLKSGLDKASPGFAAITGALVGIATEASALFPKMGDWIADIGKRFQQWVIDTDIAKIVHTAAVEFGNLWEATKNLGSIIAGVFAAMDTGKSTGMEAFAETLARVRDIVWSGGFQTALKTIFTGAAVGAEALRAALGPVGDNLEKLAPLLASFLSTAGTVAAYALRGITDALAQPVVQNGIQAALQGISDLVTNLPWDSIGLIIGSIGSAIGLIAPLISNIIAAVAPVIPLVIDAIAKLIPPITQVVNAILPALVSVVMAAMPVIEAIAGAIEAMVPGFESLAPVISMVAGIVSQILVVAISALGDIISNFIIPLIQFLAGIFASSIGVIVKLLTGDWKGALEMAQNAAKVMTDAVVAVIVWLLERAASLFGWLSSSLGQWMKDAWAAVVKRTSEGIKAVLDWLGGLPKMALDALGSVGSVLLNAGKALMDGFWNGLKQVWQNIQNWVGGIGDWIAKHKGPLSYDYRLLQPAGTAIMAGFGDSLAAGMSKVEGMVSDFAPRLSANVRVAAAGGAAGSPDALFSPSALAEAMADTLEARGMSWIAVSDRVSAVRTLAEEMA